jgi:succinoglycan biosynthesis transport protein ExoP
LIRGKAPPDNPDNLSETIHRTLPVSKEDMHSEEQMILSSEVLVRTLKALGVQPPEDYDHYAKLVAGVKSRLRTQILPASNVIRLSFQAARADSAVSLLATLMEQYLRYRLEVSQGAESAEFFAEQAEKFRDMLETSEGELAKLVNTGGSADPRKEIEMLLARRNDLEQSLSVLENQAISRKALVRQLGVVLRDESASQFLLMEGPITSKLTEKLIELKAERGKLLRTFLPSSKAVQKLEKEMREIHQLILVELKQYRHKLQSELQVMYDQIDNLRSRIENLEKRSLQLQEQHIAAQRINRAMTLQEHSYATFARRREEAQIRSAMESGVMSAYVSILDRAYASSGAVFPKPIILPLGLLSGLLLGVAIGFSREFFDHSFKKPSDVERVLGVPTIFSFNDMDDAPTANSDNSGLTIALLLSLVIGLGAAYGPWRASVLEVKTSLLPAVTDPWINKGAE